MAKASLPTGWRIVWTREPAPDALGLNIRSLAVEASSLSMACLEHGPAAFGRTDHPLGNVEITLTETPVLDEIWCLYMLAARERNAPIGRGWEAMSHYAQDVRGGFWPDRVPPEHTVQGVFSAIVHEHLGVDPPHRERFLSETLELCRHVDERLEAGADLMKTDVTDAPSLQRYRAALASDHKLYDEDVKRGSRWRARIPASRAGGRERTVGLLVLRKPLARQFKMWARTDPHAPGGTGYRLLLVEQSVTNEIVLSADPTARLKIGWLAERLDRLEGKPDVHWYDGVRHDHTLVASPKGGTQLTLDAVLGELRREVKLRRVWNRTVVRGVSFAAMFLLIATATGVVIWHMHGDPGKQIAHDNRDRVYLVVMPTSHKICTAFAVGSHELATARHCVRDAEGGRMIVIRNNTPTDKRNILRVSESEVDVALLQVRDSLPGYVSLGSLGDLDDIQGSVIFVFGFPVDTTNVEYPQAHLASTIVSMPPNDRDIQHNGVVAGGSSGSPIFNLDGRVIAVHSGAQGDMYDGKPTPFAHAVPVQWLEQLMKSPRWVDIPQ